MTNLLTITKRIFLFTLTILVASSNLFAFGEEKPISFLENKGQLIDQHAAQRSDIDFSINADGMNIFISNGKLQYQWIKPLTNGDSLNGYEAIVYNRMEVTLIGANKSITPIANDKQPYYETHFLKHNGEEVRVHTYNKIIYKNIYPNIDWVLYSKNGQLKYDFVVHKGGNPNNIKLQYDGTEKLELHDGAITAYTALGSITEQAPYSYNADSKEQIHSAYVLTDNVLSFDVAKQTNSFVIDPTLEWATYYGGNDLDYAQDIATDQSGNVYICGWTFSTSILATIGSYMDTISSPANTYDYHGYIAKFTANGTRIWGTFFPGPISGIASSKCGTIYVTGIIDSAIGLTNTSSFQNTFGGISTQFNNSNSAFYKGDAFLAKLNAHGNLDWFTFYGGEDLDIGTTVAIDHSGYIYIGGRTFSTTGLASMGAYRTYSAPPTNNSYSYPSSYSGMSGYVAKFNNNGIRQWGTFYPGMVYDIAIDSGNNVYAVGNSWHDTGVASIGAHLTTNIGNTTYGKINGFIAKFDSSGTRQWGTYFGGYNDDYLHSVACDTSDNIYICGSTRSTQGIATNNTHKTNISATNGNSDAFLAKFSATGTMIWGTYYGGNGSDPANDIVVTPNNRIFINGNTSSISNIITPNAFDTSINENYIAEFNSNGQLIYGTYYSGLAPNAITNQYSLYKIAISYNITGKLHHFSNTNSANGIATSGAFQTIRPNSIQTPFVGTFIIDTMVYIPSAFTDTVFCPGDTVKIPYRVSLPYKTNNTFSIELSDSSGNFTTTTLIGSKLDTTSDTLTCVIPINIKKSDHYKIRIKSDHPYRVYSPCQTIIITTPPNIIASSNAPICIGDTLLLSASPNNTTGITYTWTGPNSFNITGQNIIRSNMQQADTGMYVAKASAGSCAIYDTTMVSLHPTPNITNIYSNSPICPGSTLSLNSITDSNVTYLWVGPNGFTDTAKNPIRNNATYNMTGQYSLTITSQYGCKSAVTSTGIIITVTTQTPTASGDTAVCPGTTINLYAVDTNTNATYLWIGPNGFTDTAKNPTINNATPAMAGEYRVYANINGCLSNWDTIQVNIVNTTQTPQATSNTIVCPGTALMLYATDTLSNATYSWIGPNGFSSSIKNPIINNTSYNMAGTYIVTATINGCTSEPDSTTVNISITTQTPQANSNSPVCAGQPLNLFASTIPNASYYWIGPNGFTSTLQNPTITNSNSAAGSYYVYADVNGCASLQDTVIVNINAAPTIQLYTSPGDSICNGETASFVAITNNAGATPTFTWLNGGNIISGATGSSYSSNSLNNGATIQCLLSNVANCPGHTDTSNMIVMNVRPISTPTVAISANPNTPLAPFQLVTFTATTTYGGNNPTFQWMRNGNPVIGATNSTWGTYQVSNGDSIYTILTSSDRCADPDTAISNGIKIQVLVSVDDIGTLGEVTLFPNPNNGTFTIKGQVATDKEISINVMNAIGQSVYRGTAQPVANQLNHTVNIGTELAAGNYILQLQTDEATKTIKFNIR